MTHYEVLGLLPDATTSEIDRAYKRLAFAHHPDRGGDPATFRSVCAAHEVLGDAAARAAYDRQLAGEDSSGHCPSSTLERQAAAFRVADPRRLSVEAAEAIVRDMVEAAPERLRGTVGGLLGGLLAIKRHNQRRGE